VVGGECVVNGTLNSQPWPRLWHNLRASAQTDLANLFPAHVVCKWLGNTAAIAANHYLQVTDAHFDLARQWSGAAYKIGLLSPYSHLVRRHRKRHTSGTVCGTAELRKYSVLYGALKRKLWKSRMFRMTLQDAAFWCKTKKWAVQDSNL
jgi:hypothetical protein